jgi:hypothetical protein
MRGAMEIAALTSLKIGREMTIGPFARHAMRPSRSSIVGGAAMFDAEAIAARIARKGWKPTPDEDDAFSAGRAVVRRAARVERLGLLEEASVRALPAEAVRKGDVQGPMRERPVSAVGFAGGLDFHTEWS